MRRRLLRPSLAFVESGGSSSTANGVSRRLGEFVHKKSSLFADDADAMSNGYLPVKAGAVVIGAIDFPVWAAAHTEFVSGNDIVFPNNVEGMFLRNLEGGAAAEGVFQTDRTAVNGLRYTEPNAPISTQVNGGGGNTIRGRTGSRALTSGDVETNPVNRAYQLYTIVDTYVGA